MDEIDRLLAGLKNQQSPTPTGSSGQLSNSDGTAMADRSTMEIDDLLGSLDESTKQGVRAQLSQHPPQVPGPALSLDALLEQVRTEQAAQTQESLRQEQALAAEADRQSSLKAQRLEQLRLRRREELRTTAQVWLAKLSAKSEEGRWFDEFACNYESRLEAAIDYLEALQEVNGQVLDR